MEKRAGGPSEGLHMAKSSTCRLAPEMQRQPEQVIVPKSIVGVILSAYLYKDRHMVNYVSRQTVYLSACLFKKNNYCVSGDKTRSLFQCGPSPT